MYIAFQTAFNIANLLFTFIRYIPALGSKAIDDGRPVVLYMHGNAHSR